MTVVKDLLRLNTDVAMAGGEMVLSRVARRRLCRRARQGDGLPVLLLPGYLAGDRSLRYLRDFLVDCGFAAESWGLGTARGFEGSASGRAQVDAITDDIIARVRELAVAHGRKVALVGQSLGGLYARETAARYPEEIDRIITLGSPTVHPYIGDDQNAFVLRAARGAEPGARYAIAGREGFLHWGAQEPRLPCVAIWSPIDAVVFSRSARIPDYIVALARPPAIRENVRIVCSHSGMAFNEAVLLAIADRLAEPLEAWRPFDPETYYPPWAIALVERTFGSRLFHEFAAADWREALPVEASARKPRRGTQPPLLRRLCQDHADFQRLYRMVSESIEAGRFGAVADHLLLADVIRFLTDYLDRRHHPLEELTLERLADVDTTALSMLERLGEEHEQIEHEGAALRQAVENAVEPGARPQSTRDRAHLVDRWHRFCEALRIHVEAKEQELFPLLAAALSKQSWREIEVEWRDRCGGHEDPLSSRAYSSEFRQLFEYLSYRASRREQPDITSRGTSLLGRCIDGMIWAGEEIDRALERARPGR